MKKFLFVLVLSLVLTSFTKNVFAYKKLSFVYTGYSNSIRIFNKIKDNYFDTKLVNYFGSAFVNKYNHKIGFGFYVIKNYKSNTCDLMLNTYHLTKSKVLDAGVALSMIKSDIGCDPHSLNYHLKKVTIFMRKNKLIPLFTNMAKHNR